MQYKVVKSHLCQQKLPIEVSKGSTLKVGQRSSLNDGWENWIYCLDLEKSTEGWVPEQLLSIEGDHGILLEDYSAKELNVELGEIVEGFIEMNGWVWSSKITSNELGWLPIENLVRY